VLLLMAAALAGPGRAYDRDGLRARYVASLRSYEGVRYVWGGENRFGIDCSGLVRKGLIQANLRHGVLTLNPRCMRSAATMWWYDCTARALRDGYRGWTRTCFTAPGLTKIDLERIRPGDLAVTADGVHVFVYVGQGEWMEADPGQGEVLRGPTSIVNDWHSRPVDVVRWRQLE
jgi:cell wall-associated NlpC family hydrolase